MKKTILTDKKSGYAYAIRLLARQDYTKKMIKDKLLLRELSEKDANEIIKELEDKGYIDNLSYGRNFIADKCNLKNKGRKYIEFELIKRGFSKEECEILISECYSSTADAALSAILRKLGRPLESLDRKELFKVKEKLLRQGFLWDEISYIFGRTENIE